MIHRSLLKVASSLSTSRSTSRLHELKDEITRAWKADDRVTSLKLSIKVVRLLIDMSVLEFYPTLFVLATDVMDMVGDMVWERIKQKAEFSEDRNRTSKLKISVLMPKRPEVTGSSKFILSIRGNDHLFFGDRTYLQELLSLSAFVLQNLVDNIMQEPSRVAHGTMTLKGCNCIASSFNLSHEVLPILSKLMETAKLSLSSNDNYLQSTTKFVDKFLHTKALEGV